MTALKNQAVSIIHDIPNDQMSHVIEILHGLNKIFAEKTSGSKPLNTSRLEAWHEFKKYKGIIPFELNEKAEERYAL